MIAAHLLFADVRLDLMSCRALRSGRWINLSYIEYRLLLLIAQRSPAPVGVKELHERVIGRPFNDDRWLQSNTVQVSIHRLRRKLGLPKLIETVEGGYGYRLIAPVSLWASTNR